MKLIGNTSEIKHQGIWRRFLHTMAAANIPWGLLAFYVVLTGIEGQILIRIPEVSGNFFSGDVSPRTVGLFIGLDLINTVVGQSVLFVNHVLRYRMNRNLRTSLWGKILKLEPAYYDRVSASSLISRITVDSDAINTFVLDVVLEFFVQIYYLSLTVHEMNKVSMNVGFKLLAFVPLTILITFIVGRISLRFESDLKYRLSDLTNYLSELISCLPLLKAMNRQKYETRRGRMAIDEYYRSRRNVIGLDIAREIVGTFAGIGPELIILLVGIKYLANGTFDAAAWYMFYLYAGTFIGFCGTLGSMWEMSKTVQGQLNKVSDLLSEEEESLEGYVEEITADGDILFDHVDFGYDGHKVLDDASFTIPGKSNTALIGYSGAGKSTVLKLVERIYSPDSGRILMGGTDIGKTDLREYRSHLVYVSQNTPLLSGSIRDNILYGLGRTVSDEDIMEAARLVRLDGFIGSQPEGLDREVGAFGGQLSGGQKQKIAVTRALLSEADVLILDEPTASLDIVSTRDILRAIDSIRGTRTVILVTHDGDLIRDVDHVIIAEKGKPFLEGTPAEMAFISEFYRQLAAV